jgi:chorismate dehydratase
MGKISYINASPVFYGLDHGLLPDWLEMIAEPPAVLNRLIKNNEIILSPVSAAFYAMHHGDFLLVPDLSISCNGKVMSVILMSKYPLEQLNKKNIVFTEESATAASFFKMIFSMKNIKPNLTTCAVKHINDIKENVDAALIIGDAALTQPWDTIYQYKIDLGDLWYSMTKLPFVFAVWVVRKSFAENNPDIVKKIIDLLNNSKEQGYINIEKIIEKGALKLDLDITYVKKYYDHLFCDLDDKKIKALAMFFKFLYEEKILDNRPEIKIFS